MANQIVMLHSTVVGVYACRQLKAGCAAQPKGCYACFVLHIAANVERPSTLFTKNAGYEQHLINIPDNIIIDIIYCTTSGDVESYLRYFLKKSLSSLPAIKSSQYQD